MKSKKLSIGVEAQRFGIKYSFFFFGPMLFHWGTLALWRYLLRLFPSKVIIKSIVSSIYQLNLLKVMDFLQQLNGLEAVAVLLLLFIYLIIIVYFYLVFLKMTLDFFNTKSISIAPFSSCFPLIFKGLALYCLYFFPIIGSLILQKLDKNLMLVGTGLQFYAIYLLARFRFCEFLLVDKNLGLKKIFQQSSQLSKGFIIEILGMMIIPYGLYQISGRFSISFPIGIIIIPWALMFAFTYRKIQKIKASV